MSIMRAIPRIGVSLAVYLPLRRCRGLTTPKSPRHRHICAISACTRRELLVVFFLLLLLLLLHRLALDALYRRQALRPVAA